MKIHQFLFRFLLFFSLAQLYTSEPKYKNPADFISNALMNWIVKKAEFESMANKNRDLVERNEQLELELAKLRAMLEKYRCDKITVDGDHNETELAPSTRRTSIMDLNDDCLRDVCAHLKVVDLSAVADVCNRFKTVAQNHFQTSADKSVIFSRYGDVLPLQGIPNVLRNFGASIEKMNVEFAHYPALDHFDIFRCCVRYCSERLTDLRLSELDMNGSSLEIIRSILRHLRKLNISSCTNTESFLKALPKLSPGIESLILNDYSSRISHEIGYGGLIQNFSELREIELSGLNIHNGFFEGFVSLNPQLKKVEINSCKNLDDRILQSIALHLPQIEELVFGGVKRTDASNVKYLSHLQELKSFKMWGAFLLTIFWAPMLEIWEIDYAHSPLENLSVEFFHFDENADRFFAAISKLENLKTFALNYCFGLSLSNIEDFCKQHCEITELILSDVLDQVLSVADLLNIVQNAEKLKKFTYIYHARTIEDRDEQEDEGEEGKEDEVGRDENEDGGEGERIIFVGPEEFKMFANVVRNRQHHLLLGICSDLYDIKIPDELKKLHKKCFELKVFED